MNIEVLPASFNMADLVLGKLLRVLIKVIFIIVHYYYQIQHKAKYIDEYNLLPGESGGESSKYHHYHPGRKRLIKVEFSLVLEN